MSNYEDEQIARLALADNLVTAEAILLARRLQKEYRALGIESKGLGEILLEEGHLSRYLLRSLYKKVQAEPLFPSLDGYEILAKIAEGATGTVYQARQISLDRLVAVKVLSERLGEDPEYVERFEREALAAGRLSHPNVVGAIEVGESGGRRYLVMEYVEGRTVEEILRQKGTLPEKDAIDIATQVARGLAHAHAAGFVHRDVKPANILVTPEGTAKLCDLGLVRPRASEKTLTRTGYTHGTPHYMSPEQALSDRRIDGRSDLYSLGATIYKMLAGTPPFNGDTAASILVQHIRSPLVPLSAHRPGVSPALDLLVRRLLAKDPNRRPESANALLRDLARIAAGDVETLVREFAPVFENEAQEGVEEERSRGPRALLASSLALNLVLAVSVVLLALGRPEAGAPADPGVAPAMGGAVAGPVELPLAPPGPVDRELVDRNVRAQLELRDLRKPGLHPARRVEGYRTFLAEYRDLDRAREAREELASAEQACLDRFVSALGRALAQGDLGAALREIDSLRELDTGDSLGSLRERIGSRGQRECLRVLGEAQSLVGSGELELSAALLDRVLADRRFATVTKAFEVERLGVEARIEARALAERQSDAEREYWLLYEVALDALGARRYGRAVDVLEEGALAASLGVIAERLTLDAADVRQVRDRVFGGALDRLAAHEGEVVLHRLDGHEVRGVVSRRDGDEISVERSAPGGSHVFTSLRVTDLVEGDLLAWSALDPEAPEDRLVLGLFRLFEGHDPAAAQALLEASRRPDLAALATFRDIQQAIDSKEWARARAALERMESPSVRVTSYARCRAHEIEACADRIARESAVEADLRGRLAGRLLRSGGGRVELEYSFGETAELGDWTEIVRKGAPVAPAGAGWRVVEGGLRFEGAREERVLVHALRLAAPIRVEVHWTASEAGYAGFDVYLAADETCARAIVFRVTPIRAILFEWGGSSNVQRDLAGLPTRMVAKLSGGEQVLELGEPLRRRGLPVAAEGRLGLRASAAMRITRIVIEGGLVDED